MPQAAEQEQRGNAEREHELHAEREHELHTSNESEHELRSIECKSKACAQVSWSHFWAMALRLECDRKATSEHAAQCTG
jgi:hypothetical protein